MKKIIILSLFSIICCTASVKAQIDVARAGAITALTPKIKKVLGVQIETQMEMAGGHLLVSEEVKATTNFQREFNEYLDDFKDVLSIAAQIYGVYYEVNNLVTNINNLSKAVADAPTNTLAVAFSANRNTYYVQLVETSIDLIEDIRKVCFGPKMTEKEKNDILTSIRPRLKKVNLQTRMLERVIRYTSLADVWREITGRVFKPEIRTRVEIGKECMERWQHNAVRK